MSKMEVKTKLLFEGIDLLELSPVQGVTIRETIRMFTKEKEELIRKTCVEVQVDPDALLKTAQLNAKLQAALRALISIQGGTECDLTECDLGEIIRKINLD